MNVVTTMMKPDQVSSDGIQLRVEFAADPTGRTYLRRQFATYPFHICRPLYLDKGSPGLSTLYIQSCSGGLYENEKLSASFVARAGAEAHVTTQAPTVVHSMHDGRAEQRVHLEAHDGAYLEYFPDPQILFPGSRIVSAIKAHVARTATVLVWDSFLHHDPDGAGRAYAGYSSDIHINDLGGKVLAVDRLKLVPGAAPLDAVGINGPFSAQGTIVVATRDERLQGMVEALHHLNYPYADVASGVSRLPNSAGLIVRVLACDAAMLTTAMSAVWHIARSALHGSPPACRRK